MTARVVTFYSFKGGVGRTQALANVALGLACVGKHVIVVDMDLESPGLHAFFPPHGGAEGATGALEFFEECFARPDEAPDVLGRLQTCVTPLLPEGAASIRLLRAGRLTDDYARRLARFSWEEFYAHRRGYESVEYLRRELVSSGADYVLVDSRTGATDVGSVCTHQLPEVVLVFFALHEQGLHGAEQVIRAITARRDAPGMRARRVIAVPSRVDETGEDALRDEWLDRVRGRLGGIADDVLVETGRRIPHLSRAAFGEYLADPTQPNASYLQTAYAQLVRLLAVDADDVTRPRNARETLAACEGTLAEMERSWAEMTHARIGLERIVPWAERLRARNATLARDTRSLRDQLARARERLELPPLHAPEEPPDSVSAWRAVVASLQEGADEVVRAEKRAVELASAAFGPGRTPPDVLARALEPLRAGDLVGFVDAWDPVLSELRSLSPITALATRDVGLEEFARWFPGDGLHAWIELLLGNAMEALREQAVPTADLTFLNLLRLALRTDGQPRPLYWSAYALALQVATPEVDRALFDEVGASLWPRTWVSIIERSEATVAEDHLEVPIVLAQLERVAPDGAALRVGARAVFGALLLAWVQGRAENVRALLLRHAAHPYLSRAILSGEEGDTAGASQVTAALLWARREAGAPAFAPLVARLGALLAAEGRVAEAFYLVCGEAQRDARVAEGEDFDPLCAAFVRHARGMGCDSLVADVMEKDEALATLARSPEGVVWLAWVASSFDVHPWPEARLAAVRRALTASNIYGSLAPIAVREALNARRPESLISLRDALRWGALVRDAHNAIDSISIHKSLGMAAKYEKVFRRYWRSRLKPYLDPSLAHEHHASEFDDAVVDDLVRAVKAEHRDLDELVGAARSSLEHHFDALRATATELARLVAHVPRDARAAFAHRRDTARDARSAFETWVAHTVASVTPTWRATELRDATIGAPR